MVHVLSERKSLHLRDLRHHPTKALAGRVPLASADYEPGSVAYSRDLLSVLPRQGPLETHRTPQGAGQSPGETAGRRTAVLIHHRATHTPSVGPLRRLHDRRIFSPLPGPMNWKTAFFVLDRGSRESGFGQNGYRWRQSGDMTFRSGGPVER